MPYEPMYEEDTMVDERNHNQAQNQTETRLLTPDEREVCKIVAQGNVPHNRRALALLALDQGVTLADACELSGLTNGQVRYWRDKFRQHGLGIFPEDPLDEYEPIGSGTALEKKPEQAAQPGSQSSQTERADKAKKKATKGKKPSKKKTGDKNAKPKGEKTKKSKKEKKKGSKAKKQKPTKAKTSGKKSKSKSEKSNKKKKAKSEKTNKSEAKGKTSKSSQKAKK